MDDDLGGIPMAMETPICTRDIDAKTLRIETGVNATFGSIARGATKQETSACNAGAQWLAMPTILGGIALAGKPFQA